MNQAGPGQVDLLQPKLNCMSKMWQVLLDPGVTVIDKDNLLLAFEKL